MFVYFLTFSALLPDLRTVSVVLCALSHSLLYEWKLPLTPEEMQMLQRGTAETLYGKW